MMWSRDELLLAGCAMLLGMLVLVAPNDWGQPGRYFALLAIVMFVRLSFMWMRGEL